LQRRSKLALGALGILSIVAIAAATIGWSRYGGAINALQVDLASPDAYISTPALSRLPRDLVKAPLARDVLTEDFAFYYEEHEERLALAGSLKRIAFEHDTTLADKLLELVLDEPAEVALWTDEKGAPRYWLIAMTRGALARIAQDAGPLFAHDSQVSAIGELPGARGATQVLALTLSSRRTFAIVAKGNRVVVLSDPGLLFDAKYQADRHSAKTIAALLSGDENDQAVYRRHFGLEAPGSDHVLVADSSLLSFGYRHFFPGLRAVRIDVAPGGANVRTQLRVTDDAALPSLAAANTLWSGMPMGAAACSWLPADWSRARAVLDGAGDPVVGRTDDAIPGAKADEGAASEAEGDGNVASSADGKKKDVKPAVDRPKPVQSAATKALWDRFVASFDGPAAVCWYARSQLHTPLLVAHTRAGLPAAAMDESLARLAGWLIPGGGIALPVGKSPAAAHRWQREIPAPYGFYGADDVSLYRPTLAREGAWISFSPDDKLVDLALSTQERRYPSIGDTLPPGAATLAVVAPQQVADLIQREAFEVLPAQQELFHQAAEAHLVPRLEALRHWPAVHAAAVGRPSAQGWVPVAWTTLVSPRGAQASAEAPAAAAPKPASRASAQAAAGRASQP
jgi:uncharacterized protein YfaA (DUF2138 family)